METLICSKPSNRRPRDAEHNCPKRRHIHLAAPRLGALPLAFAAAAVALVPQEASANAGWAFVYLGIGFIATVIVTLVLETPLVKWCTGLGWWPALGAAAFANLISFMLGMVAHVILLGDPEALRNVAESFVSGPQAVHRTIILIFSLAVIAGALLELVVIWLISLGRMSARAATLLFAANVLLSGIGAANDFTREDYQWVSEEDVARLESYYAPEITFMRDTLSDLPRIWADEAIQVVDGHFSYPEFGGWKQDRQDAMDGLRFVSLTISGKTPRNRPEASLSTEPKDLGYPRVQHWEGRSVRVDRAAQRYTTKPRPGPLEPTETYRYAIVASHFKITALFNPPP